MIAVDTNLLVYAHRAESAWHKAAQECIRGLAEGGGAWAIPWPCLHEFVATVTHPRIFVPATSLRVALDTVREWMKSPRLALLSESGGYWDRLCALLEAGRIQGPKVHDAHIAALCLLHGVSELWTADRDFSRFPSLSIRNPLLDFGRKS